MILTFGNYGHPLTEDASKQISSDYISKLQLRWNDAVCDVRGLKTELIDYKRSETIP